MKQQLVSKHKDTIPVKGQKGFQSVLVSPETNIKKKDSNENLATTKTRSKTLEINLDEIKNPHPELVRVWKESGVQDHYMSYEDNSSMNNEKRIFHYANASKPRAEIKHRIVSLYRKREFGGKEYCFAMEHLQTHDVFHNPLDTTREIGRYQLPHIVPIVGYNPNATPDPNNPAELGPQAMGAQIDSIETVYEWEWEKIKPQLLKWYKQGIIRDDCCFTAWIGNKKYNVEGWDSFINLRFEDLILLGKTGIDAYGLFESKDMVAGILALAKEKAKKNLVEKIGSRA